LFLVVVIVVVLVVVVVRKSVMAEIDPHEAEDRDGIRFSWNAWPATRNEAAKVVVPLGCVYSPLLRSDAQSLPVVNYEPIMCKGPCRTILNPFWYVTKRARPRARERERARE
jgi:hypothetical protein